MRLGEVDRPEPVGGNSITLQCIAKAGSESEGNGHSIEHRDIRSTVHAPKAAWKFHRPLFVPAEGQSMVKWVDVILEFGWSVTDQWLHRSGDLEFHRQLRSDGFPDVVGQGTQGGISQCHAQGTGGRSVQHSAFCFRCGPNAEDPSALAKNQATGERIVDSGPCSGAGCIRQGEVGDPASNDVPGLHGLLDFLGGRNPPFTPMESTPRRHASRTMMESGCSDHAGCSVCLGPRS